MIEATKAPAPTRNTAPVKRRRRGWLIVVILMLAAGTVTAALHYTRERQQSPSPPSQGSAGDGSNAVLVETVRPSPGGIMRICTQIGSVHPYEDADLYAKVSGYLEKLHVNYGDRVKFDQILAEIFDPEVVADAEKAEADVRQAKAAVEQAEAFIEAAKADRDATASGVEQAAAEVDRYTSSKTFHSKKLDRYKRLVMSKAVPQEIADEEEEAYESAMANEAAARKGVAKVQADLIAAKARVKKAEADLDEAKANVAVAEAKRDRANALLGYTKIRAPYDGVITKRNFFRGAFIRSAAEGGTIPLLNVARTDMVYVVTQVPDRDVPLTNVGDLSEVTLDALPGEVFKGKVSRFAEVEDPTSRTMHTEIDLPNPQNRLRPGMYGIAKIFLDSSTKSSTLPTSCLLGESGSGKADVYVVKNGNAKKTGIEVGGDDGIRVEVVSGLSPNDEVIVNPSSVTEGTPVRSTPAEKSTQAKTPRLTENAPVDRKKEASRVP